MDTTYYIPHSVVVQPHKPITVIEKDNEGTIVGRYTGYYNPRTCTYTLYPAMSPIVQKTKRLFKHVVNERLIRRSN